jgi:hypothetical protein
MPRYIALLFPVFVGAAVPAGAQPAPRIAVEVGGIHTKLLADDLPRDGRGAGIDVQARLMFSALSLGVGILRSSQYVERTDADFRLSGVFVEPRYSLARASRVSLFISGVMGRMTRQAEFRPSPYDRDGSLNSNMVERTGISIGGGGGVEVAVGSFARLNASATYAHLSFDEISWAPGVSGSNVMVRTGVAFVVGPR